MALDGRYHLAIKQYFIRDQLLHSALRPPPRGGGRLGAGSGSLAGHMHPAAGGGGSHRPKRGGSLLSSLSKALRALTATLARARIGDRSTFSCPSARAKPKTSDFAAPARRATSATGAPCTKSADPRRRLALRPLPRAPHALSAAVPFAPSVAAAMASSYTPRVRWQ